MDERLGQLDALPHAGGVAADRAVALLEQPHVPEDLGGPLACRRAREAGHLRQVGHELRGRDVGRQDVVLGHVADLLADPRPFPHDVETEDRRRAVRGPKEPEQDPQERALAGPVRPDEPDHARFDGDREGVEREDPAPGARVAERERLRLDEGHSRGV